MEAFKHYLEKFFKRANAPSQGEVAEIAGVSRVALNRIVKGHARPSLETAERIAAATGTTLAKILKNDCRKLSKTA